MIALHSPNALLETALLLCPPEKAGTVTPYAAGQSVLQYGLCANNREITGMVRVFAGKSGELSLQFTLRGREETFEPSVQV
jgi:hypothetical protein